MKLPCVTAGYSMPKHDKLPCPYQSASNGVINIQLTVMALNVPLHGICAELKLDGRITGKVCVIMIL